MRMCSWLWNWEGEDIQKLITFTILKYKAFIFKSSSKWNQKTSKKKLGKGICNIYLVTTLLHLIFLLDSEHELFHWLTTNEEKGGKTLLQRPFLLLPRNRSEGREEPKHFENTRLCFIKDKFELLGARPRFIFLTPVHWGQASQGCAHKAPEAPTYWGTTGDMAELVVAPLSSFSWTQVHHISCSLFGLHVSVCLSSSRWDRWLRTSQRPLSCPSSLLSCYLLLHQDKK